MDVMDGRSQAEQLLQQGHYAEAATIYEQLIETDPETLSDYGRLGIALLLQEQEAEAQMAWMTPMMDADPAQVEAWTTELAQLLDEESDRQAATQNYKNAWLLRQHLRELVPNDLNNALQILILIDKAGIAELDDSLLVTITEQLPTYINHLPSNQHSAFHDLLFDAIAAVLHPRFGELRSPGVKFLEVVSFSLSRHQPQSTILQIFLDKAILYEEHAYHVSVLTLAHLCLTLNPENPLDLLNISAVLTKGTLNDVELGIQLLEENLTHQLDLFYQICFTHIILLGLLSIGEHWGHIHQIFDHHFTAVQHWLDSHNSSEASLQSPTELSAEEHREQCRLIVVGSHLPYFADQPAINRSLRNQLGAIVQAHARQGFAEKINIDQHHLWHRAKSKPPQQPLKIGYLSECFRCHSVGWLARWLLSQHNRNQFEVHLYSSKYVNDLLQGQFRQEHGQFFHTVSSASSEIADRIYDDQIDILIDLDSLTSARGSGVLTLKPAPVQISWLGFDAPGLPAVDYFIVDPYVVTENAQDYYTETLWRLPQTYIAVEGFEVGTPSLRRDHLNIPSDAVVYLSSQTGYKRHPDTIRLQMQIVKTVPNSYFLIKSFGAKLSNLQEYFMELAIEEGLDRDRLRFLPDVSSSFIHRANLLLADVVLDTYPYNGATTTLETLWMGIPLVTRVGEQFAARNSYTMLKNVGVEEGIAWTSEAYVDWGIRFGTDETLRKQVSWKLHQSRRSAPLWNVRQFTVDMENAYQQMWQRYCATKG